MTRSPRFAVPIVGAHQEAPRRATDVASDSARRQPPLTATYRLQMKAGFTLRHALERVEYLERLGVSHLYLSPILTARRGSMHGYDVVDPKRINPELGTREDL